MKWEDLNIGDSIYYMLITSANATDFYQNKMPYKTSVINDIKNDRNKKCYFLITNDWPEGIGVPYDEFFERGHDKVTTEYYDFLLSASLGGLEIEKESLKEDWKKRTESNK